MDIKENCSIMCLTVLIFELLMEHIGIFSLYSEMRKKP